MILVAIGRDFTLLLSFFEGKILVKSKKGNWPFKLNVN